MPTICICLVILIHNCFFEGVSVVIVTILLLVIAKASDGPYCSRTPFSGGVNYWQIENAKIQYDGLCLQVGWPHLILFLNYM